MLKFEHIFYDVVGVQYNFLSKEENNLVLKKCADLESSLEKPMEWLSAEKSPGSTFKKFNFVRDKSMKFFIDKKTEAVNQFAKYNEDEEKYECVESWFNVYASDNYQEPHSHIFSTYSSVYFPSAPEGSGEIVFVNAKEIELSFNSSKGSSGSSIWKYKPEDNMLLIFRSYLKHYVLHGNNKEKRISIASNFMMPPENYQKRFFEL